MKKAGLPYSMHRCLAKKCKVNMEDKTKQMLAFAAIPAAAIVILAYLLRAVTGPAMADLVFWAAISFGGTGALIGFISGRSSKCFGMQSGTSAPHGR